jgi:hypothetical protein
MANILKRPMFRRGGSAAEGSGITSGLTERKQYGNGPSIEDLYKKPVEQVTELDILKTIRPGVYDPELYKRSQAKKTNPTQDELEAQMGVISGLSRRMQPTTGEVIEDTAAAIAATTPDDPTKLQTFGQFLGKAGAGALGLRRKREEERKAFERQATLQVLKNLSKDEKDQLFRYAKEYARVNNIPLDQAYDLFLKRYLQGTPSKGLTRDRLFQDNINRVASSRAARLLNMGEQQTVAEVLTKMQQDSTVPKAGIIGRNAFKDAEGAESEGAEVGLNYINPTDGGIYRYDGNGKFTQIWPTK